MVHAFGLEIRKTFPVGTAELFRAMLDTNILKSLWGLHKLTVVDGARRKAYAEMLIADENWNFELTYDEIIENKLLTWKVNFDRFPDKEFDVSVAFSGNARVGKMLLKQSGFDTVGERDANEQAWHVALATLERLLK